MDPNQKQSDGAQNFNGAGNSPAFQPGWNPYMYGFQAPPASWYPQGYQHTPLTHPMMQRPPYAPTHPQADPLVDNGVPLQGDQEELANPTAENPAATDGNRRPGMRTKGSNFNPTEDVCLVKAWLEISTNPIISNGQKRERMWDRIMERYNLRRGVHQKRTLRSLQSRWRGIKESTGKFASHYATAVRENPSGMSDADKTTYAASNYADVEKHPFPYMHCWELMKDEPSWQDPGGIGSEYDAAEDTGRDSNTVDLGEPSSIQAGKRPIGRDAAKAAKKKCTSSGSASSSEYAATMQGLSLQKIALLQEESVRKGERFQQLASIDEKRYEEMRTHNQSVLQIEHEKVKIMREKHDLAKQKEEKMEDERILAIDLDACTPALRQYYQVLQEEILEKISARRHRTFGP